jgi:uncharacterized protein YndB with AHSA1/START domain
VDVGVVSIQPPEDLVKIVRTITVAQPVEVVFGYLTDFTTTTEWDPATVQTIRKTGDGGVGTEYVNTSRFLGRETQLTYIVEELVPDQRIRLRGSNSTVVATDTMTFSPAADGSRVVYTADFTFHGLTRLLAPLLVPAFKRLGDNAAIGMHSALDKL